MINKTTIQELAAQGKRLDLRGLQEYRQPLVIKTNISWTAEGSAWVQLGETVVLAGVKMAIEKPYNDSADQGGIMVNAELLPLSSSKYESGPPGIEAIELARVIDRGIRESKALDLKKLCIVPGEKAWFVTIDIITVNDAGNLFDVAGIAAFVALRTARFPVVDEKTGVIDYKKKTDRPLPLLKEPLPVTVHKVNGQLLIDPTTDEESASDARLTVASDAQGKLSAMQKGGTTPLTIEEISTMMDLALEKAAQLREEVRRQVKE